MSWYPTLGSPLTLPDLLLNVILGRRVNSLPILDHDMLLGYYWRRLGHMPVFCGEHSRFLLAFPAGYSLFVSDLIKKRYNDLDWHLLNDDMVRRIRCRDVQ